MYTKIHDIRLQVDGRVVECDNFWLLVFATKSLDIEKHMEKLKDGNWIEQRKQSLVSF